MEQIIIMEQHIHCENCNITNHRNGTKTYSHKAILPVLVAPGNDTVSSKEPEFIILTDGHNKPDCEHEAVSLWLKKYLELNDCRSHIPIPRQTSPP